MVILKGIGVFGGIAFGKITFYKRGESQVKRRRVEDAALEVIRFEKAKETAISQLKALYDKAYAEVGEANALIFDIHQMMLNDGDYCDSITNIITAQNVNAEYAVATTGDNFAKMFVSMDDDYMRERAADVKDISERLVGVLAGNQQKAFQSDEPVILVADDLAPSETVQLDKEKILAFVTTGGSTNSHTAILARMMSIPAIIGVGEELKEAFDGKEAIIDGFTGTVYIEPKEQISAQLKEKADTDAEKKRLLEQLRGKENISNATQVHFEMNGIDDSFYVYDVNMQYLGTTADILPYSIRYVLTDIQLPLPSADTQAAAEDETGNS